MVELEREGMTGQHWRVFLEMQDLDQQYMDVQVIAKINNDNFYIIVSSLRIPHEVPNF